MDECSCESLDLAALTGVLVPWSEYNTVRDRMCRLALDLQSPPPNTLPRIIELHANNLLPELNTSPQEVADEARFNVLSNVVDIVNAHGLTVIRIAYLNRTEIATHMKFDTKLYGPTFFGIESALQPILANTIVLPVMDGVPSCDQNSRRAPSIDPQLIRAFAHQVRWIHHARQSVNFATGVSIDNAENLAEPVFADSAHSVLLQMTDLVSHLLLQLEREELERDPPSPYRSRVLKIAHELDPANLRCWKGRMRCHIS
jgi:hypothetical protein